MRAKHKKKPPKLKFKLVIKLNLVIISLEWHIEFGE